MNFSMKIMRIKLHDVIFTLTLFRSRADLTLLPSATKPQELPGAGHPAYLDQPRLWHQLLHNFLVTIQQQED